MQEKPNIEVIQSKKLQADSFLDVVSTTDGIEHYTLSTIHTNEQVAVISYHTISEAPK